MFKKRLVIVITSVFCAIMLFSNGMVVHGAANTSSFPNFGIIRPPQEDPVVSRTFEMPSFNQINIGGNWVVTYVQAPTYGIRVEMPESMFERKTFTVRDNTLVVEAARNQGIIVINCPWWITSQPRPRIYVYAPSLQRVSLGGTTTAHDWSTIRELDFAINLSGTAVANLDLEIARNLTVNVSGTSNLLLSNNVNYLAGHISVGLSGSARLLLVGRGNYLANSISGNVSGTSNLYMAGRADLLTMNVSGTSRVRAIDLHTREVRNINVSGTSNVEISVSEYLSGTVSGVSHLRFRGNPTVNVRTTSFLARVSRVN